MQPTPHFLSRLGLGLEADARAVRRAYARELKLIDQEREAGAFQELRDAYEAALRWHAYQGAQAQHALQETVEGVPDAPVAEDESILADPDQLAAEAFEAFQLGFAGLGEDAREDAGPWQDWLRRCLDDDRLLNIVARTIFEARVAHLLASGWKPGHNAMFLAAINVFGWDRDQRRLRQFGYAGARVDQAILEQHLLDALPPADQRLKGQLFELLRSGEIPEDEQLRRQIAHVERVARDYPALVHLVVGVDNVERWRALVGQFAGDDSKRRSAFEINEPSLPKTNLNPKVSPQWIWFLIVLFGVFFKSVFTNDAPRPPAFSPAAPHKFIDTRYENGRIVYDLEKRESAPDSGVVLTGEQEVARVSDDISARLRYMPSAGRRLLRTEHIVTLDAAGNLKSLTKRMASVDPEYDSAVAQAIREYSFPVNMPRSFKLRNTLIVNISDGTSAR